MKNIYIMSDIHGNYDAFIKMLNIIKFNNDDTLYILGDVIDRGKDGIKILKFIRENNNIDLLMGNHEEIMYDVMVNYKSSDEALQYWKDNGGIHTYESLMKLSNQERYSLLNYVHNLKKYKVIEVNNTKYLLVHAGLLLIHNFSLEELLTMQGDNFLWIREKFIKSNIKTDYKIIFGHTPVISFSNYVEEDDRIKNNLIWLKENKIGIDCACGYNQKLACLRLNDMKEYYLNLYL